MIFTNKILKQSILLGLLFLMAACSSSRYSLKDPHVYQNNYNEVISTITDVLATERMTVIEDKYLDANTYRIYFYKRSRYIQEQEFEFGASAMMTISKLDSNKTSVQIEEQKPNPMIKNHEREYLARDIFQALAERLELNEKIAQK